MAPRLNKRQLREQQELEALTAFKQQQQHQQEEEEEEDEEVTPVQIKSSTATSAFAALNAAEEQDDGEPESDDATSANKTTKPTSTLTKPKSKSKKKKKAKGPSTPSQTDQLDEIDLALLSLGPAPSTSLPTNTTVTSSKLSTLLSLSPKSLDPSLELRRLFGTKVIGNTTPTTANSNHHARFSNNPHHSTSLRRSSFLCPNPPPGWSSPAGVLTMEEDTEDGSWSYVHSKSYKQVQLMFLQVLQQADGNRLFGVLEREEWHVDCLMQLGEMNERQGDLGAASLYLQKALHCLSSPLPPSFPSGNFKIPYYKIENRAFYIAVSRYVNILVKRGTWRTALEWSKIALACGGEEDPVGMLSFIDFLAPKSGQNQWFLDLLTALEGQYPGMRLSAYPGLAYAKALALRGLDESSEEATIELKKAVIKFPMVASLLYTALGGNTPQALVRHRRAQVDGGFSTQPSYLLSLLSTFYVMRSSPLWKDPVTLSWFQKTVESCAGGLDDSTNPAVVEGEKLFLAGGWPAGFAPEGVIRSAFVSEMPALRPFLPPSTLSTTSYSYDPLPPQSPKATFYSDTYFDSLYSSPGSTPSAAARRRQHAQAQHQMAGMRAQLAQLLAGGPGGGIELNEELREELMRELEELGRAEGGIPGGFPGGEEDSENGDEVEDAGQEGGAGLLERLRGVFGGQGG